SARRGMAVLSLILSLTLLVAFHERAPAPSGRREPLPAVQPPPPDVSLGPGGTRSVHLGTGSPEFGFFFGGPRGLGWPVTLAGLSLALPDGLTAVAPPTVMTAAKPGRSPSTATLPLQITPSGPVQVVLRIAVRCEMLFSVTLAPAGVLATAVVAGRSDS